MAWNTTLKLLREKSGESMSETAEILKIAKSTYASYEYGKREPNIEMLTKIANHYKVSIDYILGKKDAKAPVNPIDEIGKMTVDEMEKDLMAKWLELNPESRKEIMQVLRDLVHSDDERKAAEQKSKFILVRHAESKASAGRGYDLQDGDCWSKIKVVDTPEAHECDFTVSVDGDSMEPTYHNGDVLFIKHSTEIPLDKVGLFIKSNQGYIKRCGLCKITSDNPAYDAIFAEPDAPISCVGIVIGKAEIVE